MEPEVALTNLTAVRRKIDGLFALNKITVKDIERLNKEERECLETLATEKLRRLTGVERDAFIDKIALIIPASTKSQFWEHNHYKIGSAISRLMRERGCMPAANVIAAETGLSRQTVARHLKEYKTQPEFMAEMEQFKFMTPQILAKVFKYASNGDMKAARLYFEMVGALNKPRQGTVVNRQNNYIQVNNTILSQENLSQLTAEQLNQIENIITNRAGLAPVSCQP